MILYINTTANNLVEIGLKNESKFIIRKKFSSNHTQAEKLLPGIVKLLKGHKLKLSDIKGIEAANQGGSYTSLRIGVVTANALGYALKIPVRAENGEAKKVRGGKARFNLVKPAYGSDPEITVKSKKFR